MPPLLKAPSRSKLCGVGHVVGDRSWDARVPIALVLNSLRKREQWPIAMRSTHDLKPDRKSLVVETHGDRDRRKAQHVHEPREAAQRVERGGGEIVRSRGGPGRGGGAGWRDWE